LRPWLLVVAVGWFARWWIGSLALGSSWVGGAGRTKLRSHGYRTSSHRRANRCCGILSLAAVGTSDGEELPVDGELIFASGGLSQALPFPTDAALVSDDVVYEGPMESFRGREEYLAAMRGWQRDLPERLGQFNVSERQTFSLQPGEITFRWSCSFVVPLPPTARFRGIPGGLTVLPGEKVRAEAQLRAVLKLDELGRVAKHTEEIVSGFGMGDAIARYEFLTARRRGSDPISWYWQVLRHTTLEELAYNAGSQADTEDLEWQFRGMVVRNYLYGCVIGGALFISFRALTTGQIVELPMIGSLS